MVCVEFGNACISPFCLTTLSQKKIEFGTQCTRHPNVAVILDPKGKGTQ